MYASACISCLPHFHLHHPPTPSPVFLLLARSCLPLYQRCSLKAGTPSIFTGLKFLCLSPPQPLKNLPVFPSSHTYIHKHVFMEARGKLARAGGGSGIRITLNSKQRIVGPRRSGRTGSQPHRPAPHDNREAGGGEALGDGRGCVHQGPLAIQEDLEKQAATLMEVCVVR